MDLVGRRVAGGTVAIAMALPILWPGAAPGAGWSPAQTLSPGNGANPQVAVDGRGGALVAWQALRATGEYQDPFEGEGVVFAERRAGGAFGSPRSLAGEPFALRDLEVNDRGDAAVLLARRTQCGSPMFCPDEFRVAVRRAGKPFGTSAKVAGNAVFAGKVAIDERGQVVVVYAAQTGARPFEARIEARVKPPGRGFGRADVITSRKQASSPTVGVDRRGNAIAVWSGPTSARGAHGERLYGPFGSVRPPRGHFGRRRALGRPNGAVNPTVEFDSRGNAILAWLDTYPTPPIVHAVRRPAGRSFRKPQRVGVGSAPKLAFGRGGTAVVHWTRQRAYNRLDPGFVSEAAFAARGGKFGTVADVAPEDADARIGFDRRGNAVAVLGHFHREGQEQRGIEARTRPPGGAFGDPLTLSDPSGMQPQFETGPNGTGVAAWMIGGQDARVQASVLEP
jgi:hypothetical protein